MRLNVSHCLETHFKDSVMSGIKLGKQRSSETKTHRGASLVQCIGLVTVTFLLSSTITYFVQFSRQHSVATTEEKRWMLNTVKRNAVGKQVEINYSSPDKVAPSQENNEMADSVWGLPQNAIHISQEASQALKMASAIMIRGGRPDRAKQLLEHALKLAPKSPEVWLRMGYFLEYQERNLIEAESMYKRALMCSPLDSRAVASMRRTDANVQEIYSRIYHRIDKKRDLIANIAPNDPALKRAHRESYYLHIFHTNAIEGNRLSLIQTRSILETGYVVPGHTVKEHTEVLGLHDALGFINATLVNTNRAVTVEDLLEIHKRVIGYADPHIAGLFRDHQVYIANHVPPSPSLIGSEMNRFLAWLASESAHKLHPIELAGLAHYWLVHIHPFVDGNGRTARLLMNLILMQSGFPPVTINFSDRSAYYEFLQLGNDGDIRPFLRFVAECTERTLDTYILLTEKHLPAKQNQDSLRIESLFENSVPISFEISQSEPSGPKLPDKVQIPIHQQRCPFDDELCF